MVEDADEPGFPARYHRGCVEYALSVLWPQQGAVAEALEAWAAYLTYESGLMQHVTGRAGTAADRQKRAERLRNVPL